MNDHEAGAFYAEGDGKNLRAGERVTPPSRIRMTGHVPVRFPQTTIDQIKVLATEDGDSVSTWIRKVVDKALWQRRPSQTEPTLVEFKPIITTDGVFDGPTTASATA